MVHADARTPDPSGSTPYRRLFDLAEGGMGRVELSVRRGPSFQRLYAVKRLHQAVTSNADARMMFLEEGRLAGLIHHPNVVGVLDVGEDAQGPFLVMEYVDGITARDVIVQAKRHGIPTPVQIAVRIIAQAARGLATAHDLTSHDGSALELVHRDISPHNILVGFDGVARVADFGIARASGREHRTSTGVLKGKLGYMAPEVLQFQPPDSRTDLFSLGVVFYELLASRRLYGGRDDAERARRIVNEAPPDIGEVRMDVPPDAQQLLVSLLAKDPAGRPPSARAVADRLDAVLHDLVEREGVHTLEEFVRDGFASARDERQKAIQTALDGLDTPSGASVPRAAGRPRWAFAALAAVAVAVAAALTLAMNQPAEPGPSGAASGAESAGPTEVAAPPRPVEVTAPPRPLDVTVEVQTVPPGATLEMDGMAPQTTPASLQLEHSSTARTFTLRLDGYATRRESIVPDESRRLELVMNALEPPAPAREHRRARPRERPEPTKSRPSSLDTYW